MPTSGIPYKPVYGDGRTPIPSGIMILSDSPGKQEVNMKRPLVGPAAKELWNLLYRFANITRDECYITNVFVYPMEKSEDRITADEWIEAHAHVYREIERAKPRYILALGSIAIKILLPISKSHDMETINAVPHKMEHRDYSRVIVIPSFHPSASFRDSTKLQYVIDACKKLKEVRRVDYVYQPFTAFKTVIDSDINIHASCQPTFTGIDTETYGNGDPYIVSLSSIEGRSAMTYVTDSKRIAAIATHCASPTTTTVIHNALFDLPVLARIGIVPAKWVDSMTVAFLLQYLPLSLKELTYRLLHAQMREYLEVVGKYHDLSEVPDRDSVRQYACGDPDATLQIFNIMMKSAYAGMQDILDTDMRIQPMVVAMMQRGVLINPAHLVTMGNRLDRRMLLLSLKAEQVAKKYGFTTPIKSGSAKGRFFNPRSSLQISTLLYDRLSLGKNKDIRKTASKRLSTSKKMTAKMRDEHPVVKVIDEYKAAATLRSNFINKIPTFIRDDGRIHADFSMTRIPHSGRFAISKPNLMAIPVRSEDGRDIRNAFIAAPGFTFISSDLNQIELRMLAHYSQDNRMLQIYRAGEDIHTKTAMEVFGIYDASKLDDYLHRLPAKTTNFLICNLGTAYALSRELIANGAGDEWTEDRAQDLIDQWFKIYNGVRIFLDGLRNFTIRNGYAVDLFGRREIIPQIYSVNERTFEEGIRMAANQRIQSGAQGVMKKIMYGIWNTYGYEWVKRDICYPVLQIHDDIVHECRIAYVNTVATVIKTITENTVQLSIPVTSGMKEGKVWGSMEKIKM